MITLQITPEEKATLLSALRIHYHRLADLTKNPTYDEAAYQAAIRVVRKVGDLKAKVERAEETAP